jgi:plastocyanin
MTIEPCPTKRWIMSRFSGYPVKPLAHSLLLGIALSACGGGNGDGNGGTPPPTTVIAKASASGDAQSGTVGQPLPDPIRVLVTEDGAPSSGVTVTWSTTVPGASLSATSSTDASGIASNSWTLGNTAGSQSAQASLTGASGSPVGFTATAAPGAAATLSDGGGNNQSAVINSPLAARVQAEVADQFGNGVSGVAVGWSATNGTVSASSVPSDAGGISGVNVTAGGTAGPIVIIATADGLSGSPLTFTATATTEAPTGSTVNVVNDRFEPAAITVAAGTTVTWTWPTGSLNHNVVPASGNQPSGSGSPQNGPATYQFTFNTPGTYSYFCQVHGSAGMSGTVTVQ